MKKPAAFPGRALCAGNNTRNDVAPFHEQLAQHQADVACTDDCNAKTRNVLA